ncbi:methyl-accepting chemotaxis protein [Thermococcus sp.]
MEFKKKIVSVLIIGYLIIIVATAGVMVHFGNKIGTEIDTGIRPLLEKQAEQAVTYKAEALANSMQAFFEKVEGIGSIAESATIDAMDKIEEKGITPGSAEYNKTLNEILLENFRRLKNSESKIAYIYFGDKYGNMIIYPQVSLPSGYDPRIRPWYQAAKDAGKAVWTEPYKDAVTGKWMITYAIPIYKNGNLLGVVGIDIFIDTFFQEVSSLKIGETGYAYIVDEKGFIVAHPNQNYIMKLNVFKEESLKPIAEIVKSGKNEETVIYTWQGVTAIAAGCKVPSTGWYVFVKVPLSEITKDVTDVIENVHHSMNRTTYITMVLMFLLAVIICGVSYKLISSTVKPLVVLSRAAQALAEGKLSKVKEVLREIKYLEKDEIGSLIEAFEAVSKDIVGTLHGISEKLERLAEGDLSNGLSIEARGELKEIIQDLKTVSEKLKTTISEIVEITDILDKKANILAQISSDVTEAINQVNEAVQQVSIEAQRQQENINEITEGMRLVADVSNESVRSMEEFEAAVNEVVNIASEGGKKGEESAKQIGSIQEMMKDIESAVRKVSEMSRSIEEITNVITNIAEQTNLLALNAAIEAARAGEAGRGFAVVAQEIRKLAEESKQAADNIKEIISKITEEIKDAVEAT